MESHNTIQTVSAGQVFMRVCKSYRSEKLGHPFDSEINNSI